MTYRPYLDNQPKHNHKLDEITPHLVLGPRLAVEVRARVRELENRHKGTITSAERRELSRLLELLRLAQDGVSP